MLRCPVRLLSGEQLIAVCSAGDTLADLRQQLETQRGGLGRCKLNLRGSFLDDDARSIDDLGLRPGEFLVAFETRKKKKKKAAAAQPAGEAECVTPPSSPRQQWTSQGDGGRRRQPGAGIPGAGQPPPPLLASPGKLDSLLPGYLSRPNPSPVKGRLLPAPSSISEARMAPQTAGAEAASAAGAPVQQGAQPAAKRARSLLSLAAERYGGNAAGSIQVPEPPATQQLQHGTAPLAVCDPGAVAAPAAGTQHPSTNQRANLPGAALLAVPGQERQAASSDSGVGPAPTASAAAAVAHTAPRLRTAMRGAGSKRKQPASAAEPPAAAAAGRGSSAASPALAAGSGLLAVSDAELDAAAAALPLPPLAQHLEAAFVVLAQVHAFLTQQHIQATWGHLRQSAAGMHLRQPLTLADCRLVATVCPELVAMQQHVRVVPRSYRDTWRMAVSSPQKARAAVAAAAAAEAAADGEQQPLPNPMHLRTDGAGTVLAGGAAAAAACAAASGSGAAAPAAAAASDDTLVVDMADPGRGLLTRPIPAPFLQQLRRQAAGSRAGGSGTGNSPPDAQAAAVGEEGVEEMAELSGGSDEESMAAAGARGAGSGADASAGQQPGTARRPAFRINQLVRQRWCFRRAVVRTLLLVQQQQVGPSWNEGQQQPQQPQLQQPQQSSGLMRRQPRRGARAAKAASAREQRPAGPHWHPSFDPAAVTAEQLAAAGEQLSAPARAAAAAAEQEASGVDALAAARRSSHRPPAAGAVGGAAGEAASAACVRGAVAKPPQLLKQHVPCTDATQLGPARFLEHLKALPWYQGQAVHEEQMAARQAQHATPATPLAPAVAAALQLRGVGRIFTHQAATVDSLLQGRHTVVATSTASGKSLCYTIPILQALAQDRGACALLMFPTKALAQDQLRALREACAAAFGSGGEQAVPHVEVYDGDTPMAERGTIRDRAQLLITNPDMLHMSVLPVHQQFGRLLGNLKYVVVDEGHAYKGVFGCHAALVLRRLRRLCDRVYHSRPTFAVTTATLANPREHALELLGVLDVHVVAEDGSPHGPRTFVMWNPPLRQVGAPGGPSQTEARARGRREWQADQRQRRQEASQQRGSGVLEVGGQEGPEPSDAQRLSAAKLQQRRQLLEAAVGGWQPEGGLPERQQHAGLQPPSPAQQPVAAGCEQQQRQQRAPPPPPAALSAELRREVAEAKAALAAVGGSHTRPRQHTATPAGPSRPLIRRQPVSAKAAVEQLAAASAAGRGRGTGNAGGRARGRDAASGMPASSGDDEYRARLPDSKDWKAAALAAQAAAAASRAPGRAESAGGASAAPAAAPAAAGEEEEEEERRSSPIVELSLLLAECVQHGLRTIAFCKSRKLCELVTAYVRETLKCTAPHLADSIAVYRAGYSPAERREIERALFRGSLRAVAATNALELGVDVGSLDCTLHLGFPGSVASLWQQAGRAGRREQACLGIYLGWDGPLDQYFMRHPAQLFGRPVERALVDARNPSVLEAHLACAAAEAPLLLEDDQHYFGAGLPAIAAALQSAALLGRHPLAPSPRVLHYVGAVASPASKISLRAIDPERYAIVDESLGGQLLEEIEESKAFFQVYDGAVYMYQGRTYLCKKLDLDARVAVVRPADVKYYTKCIDFTDVHVRGGRPAFPPAAAGNAAGQGPRHSSAGQAQGRAPAAACSQAVVTVRWLGFRRIWRGTGQVFDTVDLFLPDVQFETEAAYCCLPQATRRRLKDTGLPFRDGVHAACHALLNVLPLYLMCNPNDVGTECDNPYDTRYKPERILIFDKHPGGIGLAAAAAPLFPELLRAALSLVRECGCSGRSGCPACVQHTECSEYNAVLHKRAAAVVLESLLEDGAADGAGPRGEGQTEVD